MYGNNLSNKQAVKYLEANLVRNERPKVEDIDFAVEWINRLIEDERQYGVGVQSDQLEIFNYLVSISRKRQGGGTDPLAKMMLMKWVAKTHNLYGLAYRYGHTDGNINGSFHTAKREVLKAERGLNTDAKRAVNGKRLNGATSRAKIAKEEEARIYAERSAMLAAAGLRGAQTRAGKYEPLKKWALEKASAMRGGDKGIARKLFAELPSHLSLVSDDPERLIYDALRAQKKPN